MRPPPSEMKLVDKMPLSSLITIESEEAYENQALSSQSLPKEHKTKSNQDHYLAISEQVSQDGATTRVPAASSSNVGRLDSALLHTNKTYSVFPPSTEFRKEMLSKDKNTAATAAAAASESQLSSYMNSDGRINLL